MKKFILFNGVTMMLTHTENEFGFAAYSKVDFAVLKGKKYLIFNPTQTLTIKEDSYKIFKDEHNSLIELEEIDFEYETIFTGDFRNIAQGE